MSPLCAAIEATEEPLAVLAQLLRVCRDEHALLWERAGEPAADAAVADLVGAVDQVLPAPGTASSLTVAVRQALTAALRAAGDIPPVVVAHALAARVDARYGHTFTDSFRRRSPYT